MNNSPQNTDVKSTHRTGIDNSDEEDWSGVVECVINLFFPFLTLFLYFRTITVGINFWILIFKSLISYFMVKFLLEFKFEYEILIWK